MSCGFVLDGAELFPGPWALWPIAGLTLVLISAGPTGGSNDPHWSATRFLSNKPLAWIGDHAYALYLWHWPLLIYYLELRDRDAIGLRGGLVILAITVVLAILMYRFVEVPLKNRQQQRKGASARTANKIVVTTAAGTLILTGAGTTMALNQPSNDLDITVEGLDPQQYPGAAQYFHTDPVPDVEPFPPLAEANEYVPAYLHQGCGQDMGNDPGTDEVLVCEDDNAPEDPTATVVLAGGSHAGHLEAAFKTLGAKYGWEVLIVTKSSCVFGWEEQPGQTMCGNWNNNFIDWLKHEDVDLVVTPGTRLDKPEYVLDAAPKWWHKISDTGTDLLLVRGTPRGGGSVPDCLAMGNTSQECGRSKKHFAEVNPLSEMKLPENVYPIDVTKYVCPQIENPDSGNCDAIVGNIVVWYDQHHFSAPFAESLAPGFEAEIKRTVPKLLR